VPFGCFRKEIFDRIGLFDEELIRNQDDELNGRIIKNGGKIFLIPDVIIDYFARDEVSKFSKMFYQYGLFKPLVNKKLGAATTIRQFFPVLFVLLLITTFFFTVFQLFAYKLLLAVVFVYFMLAITFAIKESENIGQIFLMPILYFILHLSYGWGYLVGIFKFVILNKSGIKVAANR